ncbi:hypothetical protein [Parabacteroides bouchesdurhonensis]|uniref:hypothetical protein n=1 Tax=Parabacteroides bouchesdurhonensis TaxID=1936995 RepID=UPI000C84880A|nr:hypothetical protein [Parabacteroides bouchesdurhonensis]
MKKRGILGIAAASALLLLTSCLGDSNNEQTLSAIPGVVSVSKDYKTIVETAAGVNIYSPNLDLAGYTSGDCVLASFTINFDDAQNANAATNGYYYVALNATPEKVDKWYVNPTIGDTTKLMDKEQPVASPIDTRYGGAYLKGILFLYSDFSFLNKQETRWTLSYDANQVPTTENGKQIYSIFLRASVITEGSAPTKSEVVVNAFEAKTMIDLFNSQQKSLGNKEYYVTINYVKEINKDDPTKFTWASTDPTLMKFTVPTDN